MILYTFVTAAPLLALFTAALVLGRRNIFEALVFVWRKVADVFYDWVVKPIRAFFRNIFELFETYILLKIFNFLVYIKLFTGVTFNAFRAVFYAALAIWLSWALSGYLPPAALFVKDGYLRWTYVVSFVVGFFVATMNVIRVLLERGFSRSAACVSVLITVTGIAMFAWLTVYPNTNDAIDLRDTIEAWVASLNSLPPAHGHRHP